MNVGTLKQWFLGWIKKEEKDGEKKDSSRYLRLILALGLAGMLLIGLSECSFGSQKTDALPANVSSESSTATQDAAIQLEQRLLRVLQEMEGVGRVEVMITMEGTGESVYATEEKEQSSNQSQYTEGGETLQSIQNNRTSEENYLLVENQDGKRQALLVSRSEPQVKGVIVICEGADQSAVCQAVTEAVTTVLHITSNRVYVAKARSGNGYRD